MLPDFALNPGRRERNFWMQRHGTKNRRSNARAPTETKVQEMSGQKSPQKRPIRRCLRHLRFARAGWWCAQSSANRSPAKFPDIREFTGKNLHHIALFRALAGRYLRRFRQSKRMNRRLLSGNLLLGIREITLQIQRNCEIAMSVDLEKCDASA